MKLHDSILPRQLVASRPAQHRGPGWFERRCRRAVLGTLHGLHDGCLVLQDGDELWTCGDAGTALSCSLTVHDPAFWSSLALGGSIGAANSYVRGDWDCDDLTALVRLLCRNRGVLDGIDGGLAALLKPLRSLAYRLRRNSLEGSLANIRAHYDIGNELFGLMLDETMLYSSAIYPRADAGLFEGQVYKCRLLAERLQLDAADHLLEIGTGWGGFAIYAARHYGCRVTTTTISRQQYELAARRIAAAGLEDRITLLQQDYRELQGSYDKIVNVEMIEAVGWEYYQTFFQQCQRLLAPDGLMVMQAITIADDQYERAKREVDFIKKFIFPGSCIPSVAALSAAATRAGDLRLLQLADHTPHYARTLADWHANCEAEQEAIAALGYDEAFQRLWRFYLCYCEGGFAERAISGVHLTWARPGYRQPDNEVLGYR